MIRGALVAIEYDDGETHVWRLIRDVEIDEHFERILVGPGAGLPHFDLHVRGRGTRDDVEAWRAHFTIKPPTQGELPL